jgi:hypothetical protein
MRLFSAEQLDLVMPRVRAFPSGNPTRVFSGSPKTQRRAVYRFAQYFRREFGYDFVQYGVDGDETDRSCVAYLWHLWQCAEGESLPCIGAACFRERKEGGPALQWVWIHPFMRRQGLLANSWEMFEALHPNFAVEFPLSDAMLKFLEDRGHAQGIKGWYVDLFRDHQQKINSREQRRRQP